MRRRQVLTGGAALAAGLVVTAGCGGGDQAGGSGEEAPAGTTGPDGDGASSPTGNGGSTGGQALVAVDDVPVGGAVSATDGGGKPLIVAQPESGTVVAFSAICTHQGCTVTPDGSQLRCPCHGSVYDAADGSNVSGPAPSPLAQVEVTVVDGEVVEA